MTLMPTESLGFSSALFGYNERLDSLKWYGWDMTYHSRDSTGEERITKSTAYWVDYAMALKFDRNGQLNFSRDYRGHGGSQYDFALHYDKKNDRYSGTINVAD